MSFTNLTMRITGGVLLIAVLAGCSSLTPIPTLTPAPTVDIQSTLDAVKTQSAITVVANLTQNAPTSTPTTSPTLTAVPSFTPQATATNALLPLWTATPTGSWLGCEIKSSSPAEGASINSSTDFDASWVVKNTGTETWDHNNIDIKYSSGDKLQKSGDLLDLNNDVASGASYTITVNMHTPTDTGLHTATWIVSSGAQTMCTLTLTILVK